MTPFGAKVRSLRLERGISLRSMAKSIGVSAAYLSALEHGKRGRPSWYLVQRIIAFFNVIWDDAEDLARTARISHPKVTIDTSGLDPAAAEFINELAAGIGQLDQPTVKQMSGILMAAKQKRGATR